jgi:hypothetical protein
MKSSLTNCAAARHCVGRLDSFGSDSDNTLSSQASSMDEDSGESSFNSSSSASSRRKVGFSKVQVRDYSVVIGDHPECEKLPLSLGWSHTAGQTLDIDEFERARSAPGRSSSFAQSSFSKRLSYTERKNILRRVTGLPESEIIRIDRHRLMKEAKRQSSQAGY